MDEVLIGIGSNLAQPETLLERSRRRWDGLLRQKLLQQFAHDASLLLDELGMYVDW